MKKEKNTIIKESIDSLLDMFKTGKMPERIAFSIIRRRSGADDQPSDKWSIGNHLIMLANDTDDARGYKQWQSVGRQVKKGTQAFHILAPLTRKYTKKNSATGKEEDKIAILGFLPVPVFRHEDTNGEPLAAREVYKPEMFPPFWDVAEKMGIKTTYAPMTGKYLGRYSMNTNSIKLCAHDTIVYFHELAHAVHATFVDLAVLDIETAEVTAEFSACVMAEIQGIHGYEQQGLKYIEHYCKSTYDKPETAMHKIIGVLNDVEKIVSKVIDVSESDPNEEKPHLEAV